MAAFQNLSDVLAAAVKREKKLADLYDVAEIGLKNPDSSQLVKELNRDHHDKLDILTNLQVKKFGSPEWIKYPPAQESDDVVPQKRITRETPPEDILRYILEFEKSQQAFYQAILEKIVSEKAKELLESLVTFKRNQAKGISTLLREFDSVTQ